MKELRKLEELRADSLITEDEFEKQKAILVPSENNNATTYNLLGLGKGISITVCTLVIMLLTMRIFLSVPRLSLDF